MIISPLQINFTDGQSALPQEGHVWRYFDLQDLEAGKFTEAEMFAGTIMRFGQELNIPTPVNGMSYHGITVMEEKTWELMRNKDSEKSFLNF